MRVIDGVFLDESGPFPQLRIEYKDAEPEFLPLTTKSAFRLQAWLRRIGLEGIGDFDFDETTNAMIEPDLTGVEVP